MRHRSLTLFFSILLLLTANAYSQSTISGSFNDADLITVLEAIRKECKVSLSYDPQPFTGKKVSLVFLQTPAEKAFKLALKGTAFEARALKASTFVLVKKTAPDPVDTPFSIRDADTGEPLPYATLRNNRSGVLADASGKVLPGSKLRPGDTLLVKYLGYKSRRIILKASTPDIYLKPVPTEIQGIIIKERPDLPVFQGSSQELVSDVQSLEPLSVLGEKDVFRALQWIPGISGTEESSQGLYIRGGRPEDNLVLLDGIPIYNTGHFFGMFHAFNADALSQVRTFRSNFGAEYGGRVSGVIDIEGKPDQLDTLDANLSSNLIAAGGMVAVPVIRNKLSLMVAGRRSFNDLINTVAYQNISDNVFQSGRIYELGQLSTALDSFDLNLDPVSYFQDFHAGLLWRVGERDDLRFSFYQGQDKVRYAFSEADSLEQEFRSNDDLLELKNLGVGLTMRHQFGDSLFGKGHLSYSQHQRTYLNEQFLREAQTEYRFSNAQYNEINTLSMDFGLDWKPYANHDFKSGIDLKSINSSFQYETKEFDDSVSYSVDASSILAALYLQHSWQALPKLNIQSGFRLTWSGSTNELHPGPRLHIRYQPTKKLSLTAAWGYYHQFLNTVTVNNGLRLGEDFMLLASDLDSISALAGHHVLLEGSWKSGTWWVNASLYYKSIIGVLNYTRSFDREQNASSVEDLLTEGQSEMAGIDLLIRKVTGPWTSWLGYSLSSVRYGFEFFNDGDLFPALHDHAHELKLINQLTLNRWQISLMWVLASGKAYSPVLGIDTTLVDGEVIYDVRVDQTNPGRLPPYHRMDLSVSYQFPLGKIAQGQVSLTFFNLYNKANIKDRNYAIDLESGSQTGPGIATFERDLLGFAPNLALGIRF